MFEVGYDNFSVPLFYIEICAVCLMFCHTAEKRPHCRVRFVAMSVAALLFFFFFPRLSPVEWLNFSFILLFVLSGLTIGACYKISLRHIVMYCIIAASLQNMAARLSAISFSIALREYAQTAWRLIVNVAVFVVVYMIFESIYTVRNASGRIEIRRSVFTVLLLVTLAVVFVISPLSLTYVSDPQADLFITLLTVIADLMLLLAEFGVFEKSELARDKELIDRMLQLQQKQHKLFENNIDIINVKCHDMRRQIELLHAAGDGEPVGSYLSDIEKSVRVYEAEPDTGNKALDIVLGEYGLYCEAKKIRLNVIADGGALSFMDTSDIWGLFGNALENAVEALTDRFDETERLIEVRVRRECGCAVASISNRYDGPPLREGALPRSTKSDNGWHGYGIRSMRFIAEKYGGDLSVSADDGFFTVRAVFREDERSDKRAV